MGKAENRNEEHRVWRNRLNNIFEKNGFSKEELKDSKMGKQLKNSGNPLNKQPNVEKHIEQASSIKKDRRDAKAEIVREVRDMSEVPTPVDTTSKRQQLENINQLIDRYNDFIIQLEERKYELEKEIAYDEWYNS